MEERMTGVTFVREDGKLFHTFHEFGILQLAKVEMTPPNAKRHIIDDVPGADGQIDITSEFGPIRFSNRLIRTSFDGQDFTYDEWVKVCEKVYDALHGRYCKMILDIDPEYYYEGYVSCSSSKEALETSEMEIEMDAFPYKRRNTKYHAEYQVSGSRTVTIMCDRMPTAPIFTASNTMTVEYDEYMQSISNDETEAEFEITEGENELTFKGNGKVTIEWDGGMF